MEDDFRTSLANTTARITSLSVQISATGNLMLSDVQLSNGEDQWCPSGVIWLWKEVYVLTHSKSLDNDDIHMYTLFFF